MYNSSSLTSTLRTAILLATLTLLATPFQTHAQTLKDSVRVNVIQSDYAYDDFPYSNCGTIVWGHFPDAKPGATYTLSSTNPNDSNWLKPTWRGSNPLIDVNIPDGHVGFSVGSTGVQGGSAGRPDCSYYAALYASFVGTFGDWYAVWELENGEPVAMFESEVVQGKTVRFDGSFANGFSHEALSTGNEPVASYAWDLGNGDTQTAAAFDYEYAEPGTYTVTLVVTDNDGETDDYTAVVFVPGVLLEYSMELFQSTVYPGGSFLVRINVKNIGSATAQTVVVPRLVNFRPIYPESGYLTSTNAVRNPTGDTSWETFTNVGPGATVSTTQIYGITASAYETINAVQNPVDVIWEGHVVFVSGTDEDGDAAKTRAACIENCPSITVKPSTLIVEMALSTVNDEVTGGRERRPDNSGRAVYTTHLYEEDNGDGECFSGCVDVSMTVKDGDGNPVEGALVELSAEVERSLFIRGDGVFCADKTTANCGVTLTLSPTGADGKASAKFWYPGVTKNAPFKVKAVATKAPFDSGTSTEQATAVPARIDFRAPPLGVARSYIFRPILSDLELLAMGEEIITELKPSLLGDWCAGLHSILRRPTRFPVGRELITAIERGGTYACGRVRLDFEKQVANNDRYASELRQKLAPIEEYHELVSLYWLLSQVGMGLDGNADNLQAAPYGSLPFLSYNSVFIDEMTAVARMIATQFRSERASPDIIFEPFEMSYLDANDGFTDEMYVNVKTTGIYRFEFEAYIDENYDADIWLRGGAPPVRMQTAAELSATIIAVNDTYSNLAKSDQSATVRGIDVGHVIVIGGGTSSEETVQVAAVSGSNLTLTTPLRRAQPEGAEIRTVDSTAVGPPPPPALGGGLFAHPTADLTPTLSWQSRSPAVSYSLDIAIDSTFETLWRSVTNIPNPFHTVSADLEAGTQYFWRVAATNNLGTGEWSRPASFTTGPPAGDAHTDARPLSSEIETSFVKWNIGGTSQAGEAQPSCGSGDNSIWFSFTPSTSATVSVETFESDYDTIVSVWTGTSHPLAEVACNDDYTDDEERTTEASYVEFDANAGTTYLIRVAGRDGAEGMTVLRVRAPSLVGVDGSNDVVPNDMLVSVYPNPVQHAATLAIDLPEASDMRVEVYDMLGRRALVIADGSYPAGSHSIRLDATGLKAGTYIVTAGAGTTRVTRLFTVLR